MEQPVTDHFAYGGQAVVEGVMMRGRREMAVAVRTGSGELIVWAQELNASRLASMVRDWPMVRGAVLLWDAMTLGLRALVFSSAVGVLHAPTAEPRRKALPSATEDGPRLWPTLVASIVCTIGLFFVLPLAAAAVLDQFVDSTFVVNLIEGLIRLGLLVAYVHAIGFLPDVRRVFGYHGAEHKAIHAWEAGAPIDVAHVRHFPVARPRCGTGFMLVVLLLSLLLFVALGPLDVLPRLASRIVFVPVMAGIAYELLTLRARHPDHPLARVLLAPGLQLQRLTTREPDDGMLEVAIAALLRVLAADGCVDNADPRLRGARAVDANARPLSAPPETAGALAAH